MAGHNVIDASVKNNSSQLSLLSFNMHGYNQGITTVSDLVDSRSPDLIMLQEHWLTPANLARFDTDFQQYYAFASSAMELCVQSGPLFGRPFGGVAILVSNKLLSMCELIHAAERFIVLKVSDTLFINVYLPCQGTKDRNFICQEVFDQILCWRSKYNDCSCLIGGDFNTNLDVQCSMSDYINDFLHTNSFLRADASFVTGDKFTYVNDALNQYNKLDYFVYDDINVTFFDVIDPDINFSDHLPIAIDLCINVGSNVAPDRDSVPEVVAGQLPTTLRWDHGDLLSYYNYTGYWLLPLFDRVNDVTVKLNNNEVFEFGLAISEIYTSIVDILNSGATCFVPRRANNFYKFWWDEEVNLLKEESIESDRLWKAAGRPRRGPIFDKRQSCRLRYRQRLREGQRLSTLSYTNDLHECLLRKNGPEFWKSWNSKFRTVSKCLQVDGCVDSKIIAGKFADHFSKSYTSNSAERAAELQSEFSSLRKDYIGCPLTDDYLFDVELVGSVLLKLKRGKAAGIDQLTVEHLLYSHPVLPCILSKLFNLILLTGHVPYEFGHSYTVPLLKSHDSRVKSVTTDDFRGISISPIVSKVFEHCVLNRFDKFFCTSINQFGFKKGVSCSNAIYNVRMTIDHYINCGSTVNLCAVDLSKAFDKVNHNALLIKLMNRKLPVQLLDTLENLLSICWSCVKWNTSMSAFFKIDFGVRQGSVLSPHLFAVLLDDMVAQSSYFPQ